MRPVVPPGVAVARANADQSAQAGAPFRYDATQAGRTFRDSSATGLTYRVAFDRAHASGNGLARSNGVILGIPVMPGTMTAVITATAANGRSASNQFVIGVAPAPVTVVMRNPAQSANVGVLLSYDATQGGATFRDPAGGGLTYTAVVRPSTNGVAVSAGGRVAGTPVRVGVVHIALTATDARGLAATDTFSITVGPPPVGSVSVKTPIAHQFAPTGVAFTFDATQAGTTFADPRAGGLTYRVAFAGFSEGLTRSAGRISGTPIALFTVDVTITATDIGGARVSTSFQITFGPAVHVFTPMPSQSAVVGVPLVIDGLQGGMTFTTRIGLRYVVTFQPSANGLSASGGQITGTPLAAGVMTVSLRATDGLGATATTTFPLTVFVAAGVSVNAPVSPRGVSVGSPVSLDLTQGKTTFADPRGGGLTYTAVMSPSANGLSLSVAGGVSGTPLAPLVMTVSLTARDAGGSRATTSATVVAFGAGLTSPTLPLSRFLYSDGSAPLPPQYALNGPGGVASTADNTTTNPITNAGATLGRVLFYDKRLSANDQLACARCHQQRFGFSDTAKFRRGFAGGLTARKRMGLTNARYYASGHFFWDQRANLLEDQVLQPIQNSTEMGLTLANAVAKVQATSYYQALFQTAFGSPTITSDKLALALAQYVRSIVSGGSKYDQAFAGGEPPNFAGVFRSDEIAGQALFNARCAGCHGTNAHISDNIHNNGLDAVTVDAGAGLGRFKAPSLRNVEKRGRYMHDGRFASLDQVVAFYNAGVQNNPNLDPRLRAPGGGVRRLNLTAQQQVQLVAYLKTLTDNALLTNPKFASPFP